MPETNQAKFKCLRCGNEYQCPYDPAKEPQERACPKCASNSVRRIKNTTPPPNN